MKSFSMLAGVCVVLFVVALLVVWPFMCIWNYAIVAAVSVAKPIEYWVAFWLMVFMAIFFAGAKSGSKSSS